MTEATTTFKLETITYHGGSKWHHQAETIIKNTKETPIEAPAVQIRSEFDQKKKKWKG